MGRNEKYKYYWYTKALSDNLVLNLYDSYEQITLLICDIYATSTEINELINILWPSDKAVGGFQDLLVKYKSHKRWFYKIYIIISLLQNIHVHTI